MRTRDTVEEQRRELELLRAHLDAEAERDSRMVASTVMLGLGVPPLVGMLAALVVNALGLAEVAGKQLEAHQALLGGAAILWFVGVFLVAASMVNRRAA